MNITQNPYHLLVITSVTAALVSLLPLRWSADINLPDTYLVMQYSALLRFWAVLLLALWGVNVLSSGMLKSVSLNWVHTVAVLLAFLGAHLLLIEQGPPRYSQSSSWSATRSYLLMRLPFIVMLVALGTGVVALLLNYVFSARLIAADK